MRRSSGLPEGHSRRLFGKIAERVRACIARRKEVVAGFDFIGFDPAKSKMPKLSFGKKNETVTRMCYHGTERGYKWNIQRKPAVEWNTFLSVVAWEVKGVIRHLEIEVDASFDPETKEKVSEKLGGFAHEAKTSRRGERASVQPFPFRRQASAAQKGGHAMEIATRGITVGRWTRETFDAYFTVIKAATDKTNEAVFTEDRSAVHFRGARAIVQKLPGVTEESKARAVIKEMVRLGLFEKDTTAKRTSRGDRWIMYLAKDVPEPQETFPSLFAVPRWIKRPVRRTPQVRQARPSESSEKDAAVETRVLATIRQKREALMKESRALWVKVRSFNESLQNAQEWFAPDGLFSESGLTELKSSAIPLSLDSDG